MTAVLGILMLDNAFHRYPGDLGNPATFDFPVRYARVAGATTEAITTLSDDRFLEPFTLAAHDLVARGAEGIVTSCGFLALYQKSFARRLPVPVATSALLQVAWVQALLPAGRRVGVVTFNGATLLPAHLAAVGAPTDTPIVGLADHGRFRRALLGDSSVDGYGPREAEAVEAAERLVRTHPDVGALVLECTNLAPHAAAMQAVVRRPVYDVMSLVRWFHGGLSTHTWPIS